MRTDKNLSGPQPVDPGRVTILPPQVPVPDDDDGDDGVTCDACGAVIDPDDTVCIWCGESL